MPNLYCETHARHQAGLKAEGLPPIAPCAIRRDAILKKTLLILMAVASLTVVTHAQAQGLQPAQTQLQWEGWDIKINELVFSDAVGSKTAGADSTFVKLGLTVQNISHKGQAFIPQNDLKIIIGEDAFDAEDIDPNGEYMGNIEPTLVRQRACYF
jgi:hypothetical protein